MSGPIKKVRTLQKVSFTYKKMILKIVVWNQLSSKKICRTSFEITVLSYITWRYLCWCLSALERARQENIFCMFVATQEQKSSFQQKTPQKCNILTLLCVKQLCKVWSHLVTYSSHSHNRIRCDLDPKSSSKMRICCTWHGYDCEKNKWLKDSKLCTTF